MSRKDQTEKQQEDANKYNQNVMELKVKQNADIDMQQTKIYTNRRRNKQRKNKANKTASKQTDETHKQQA